MEFGRGSHINFTIAVLIWLMIITMMMKVDFAAVWNVGKRPRGLLVTLFVNWIAKPFSMAFLAWLFFRFVFASWITPPTPTIYCRSHHPCGGSLYRNGVCVELSHRRRPGLYAVQVSVNDLIMLVLFAPLVGFLVSGAASLHVPYEVLLYSVLAFIVISLTIGVLFRQWFIRNHGNLDGIAIPGVELGLPHSASEGLLNPAGRGGIS